MQLYHGFKTRRGIGVREKILAPPSGDSEISARFRNVAKQVDFRAFDNFPFGLLSPDGGRMILNAILRQN